jgi:hypothetical protein
MGDKRIGQLGEIKKYLFPLGLIQIPKSRNSLGFGF